MLPVDPLRHDPRRMFIQAWMSTPEYVQGRGVVVTWMWRRLAEGWGWPNTEAQLSDWRALYPDADFRVINARDEVIWPAAVEEAA